MVFVLFHFVEMRLVIFSSFSRHSSGVRAFMSLVNVWSKITSGLVSLISILDVASSRVYAVSLVTSTYCDSFSGRIPLMLYISYTWKMGLNTSYSNLLGCLPLSISIDLRKCLIRVLYE